MAEVSLYYLISWKNDCHHGILAGSERGMSLSVCFWTRSKIWFWLWQDKSQEMFKGYLHVTLQRKGVSSMQRWERQGEKSLWNKVYPGQRNCFDVVLLTNIMLWKINCAPKQWPEIDFGESLALSWAGEIACQLTQIFKSTPASETERAQLQFFQ